MSLGGGEKMQGRDLDVVVKAFCFLVELWAMAFEDFSAEI